MSKKTTAGAFDIRNIIAILLGVYGVVLIVMGLITTKGHEIDKADGLNVNLWGGLAMLIVAILMGAWGYLRPVVVPGDSAAQEEGERTDGDPDGPAASAAQD